MKAIYKRELRAYFHSFWGWCLLAAFLFILGISYTTYSMYGGSPYSAYAISYSLLYVMIILAFMTMNTFGKEKRNGTDELLWQSPVSVKGIVIGKFLSHETVLLVVCVIFSSYMLVPAKYGKVPMAENLLATCGLFLFGSVCIAVGMFASALLKNRILSVILAGGLLILSAYVPNNWLSISVMLDGLMNGLLDYVCVLYYLGLVATFLIWAGVCVKASYQKGGKKQYMQFIPAMLPILVFGILTLLDRLPKNITQKDVTVEGIYSLSKESLDILSKQEEKVRIYVLCEEDKCDSALRTLLGRYEAYGKGICVQFIEDGKRAEFVQKYTEKSLSENSLIVESEKRARIIDYTQLYSYVYQIDPTTNEYYATATGFDAEGQITAAVSYVLAERVNSIYVIGGYEEYLISDVLSKELTKRNYNMIDVNPSQSKLLPEEADMIWVAGPLNDYPAEVTASMKQFLDAGKNALFMVSFSETEAENYQKLLKEYGVEVVPGVVFEEDDYYYQNVAYYLSPDVCSSQITETIYQRGDRMLLPQCRGLVMNPEQNTKLDKLLVSSTEAYSKVDVINSEFMSQEEGDILGPFALAVFGERQLSNEKKTNYVVIGTEYVMDPDFDAYVSGNNYEFILSAVEHLTPENEATVIPEKKYEVTEISMKSGVIRRFGRFVVIILPGIALAVGIFIFFLRRRKKMSA